MSFNILHAHTGDRLAADLSSFTSIDALKLWLAEEARVATSDQILLLPSGKQAKFHTLAHEQEVFLYDRHLISATSRSSTSPSSSWTLSTSTSPPPNPQETSSNVHDIEVWKQLFDARRSWAHEVERQSESLAAEAQSRFDAVVILQRALVVAVENLQRHVKSLESKYAGATQWNRQAGGEQKEMFRSLEVVTGQLGVLPARIEFLQFLPKLSQVHHGDRKPTSEGNDTLGAFLNLQDVEEAARMTHHAHKTITDRLDSLKVAVGNVSKERDALVSAVEKVNTQSSIGLSDAVSQLMEEIRVLTDKIAADSKHISVQDTQRLPAQASKMASQYMKNYLPACRGYYEEMVDFVRRAEDERRITSERSMEHMQGIARVEASFSQVNAQLGQVNYSKDVDSAFEYINLISQLPFVYGALLIEAVRRHEWSDRLRSESTTLAEDIAGYREEEERRRKRWLKLIHPFVNEDDAPSSALHFELNIQADEQAWPAVTRADISNYLGALRKLEGVDEIVDELSDAAKELDRPTKRQIKKAKAFKNGSIHEASNLKGSFLLRETDEIRALRELNTKVEDDLKAQKSRVRKLEDLLYKQQQSARPASVNLFSGFDGQRPDGAMPEPGSPSGRTDSTLSRKASDNSRRTSTVASNDERATSKKIIALEAELREEKQKRQDQARASVENETRIRMEIEESHSTKKDLMDNMEQQQHEFANERRLLQEEVKEHQLKLEEMEEEIDRVIGSRDNERHDLGTKLRNLEAALKEARNMTAELRNKRDTRIEEDADQLTMLHNIRAGLNAEGSAPLSIPELLGEIQGLSERSSRQVQDLSYNLRALRVDKEALQAGTYKLEKEHDAAKNEVKSLNDQACALRNENASSFAKLKSVSSELEDARSQLRLLHSKFADGETGSEALRTRLEEQAARASELAAKLAQSMSHVNSLDFELSSLQQRHDASVADALASARRLEQRSVKDKELTQRLVAINDELVRLLDALGLSIISRDGAIAIQRTSKVTSASTPALVDPVQSPLVALDDLKPEPTLLKWMQAGDLDEESRLFTGLKAHLSFLDLSMFSEAIIKLRRDVEWTGKKWKQEARNYRERYHRAQSEANAKIAFRSFREGDLALFLPTRNQATRPWAAFNVGAPHYFLREQDAHKLQNREWLVARISRVEERIVDLSKAFSSTDGVKGKDKDTASIKSTASEGGVSFEDDNPFELSDGLRWYLIDAAEEKPGAPSTPGLGKSTVASANVDAKGSIRMKKSPNDASKTLNRNLESRRSSTSSKRASISAIPEEVEHGQGTSLDTGATHLRPGSRSSGLGMQHAGSSQKRDIVSEEHTATSKSRPIPGSSPLRLGDSATSPLSKLSSPGLFGSPASSSKPDSRSPRSPLNKRVDLSPAKTNPLKLHLDPSMQYDDREEATSFTELPVFADPKQRSLAKSTNSSRDIKSNDSLLISGSSFSDSKMQASPAKQTAWESLWSLDIGVEEGRKDGKKQ